MGGTVSMLNSARFCEGLKFVTSENSIPRTWAASEYSAIAEAALSIDLILEKIISQLDTASLKTSRLISSHWKDLGAVELRKRVFIRIHFYFETNKDRAKNTEQLIIPYYSHPSHMMCVDQGKGPDARFNPLDRLLFLIGTSTKFPCDSFVISTQTISSAQFRNLMSKLGPLMKNLKLCLDVYVKPRPASADQDDSQMIKVLKKLLALHAPNLKNFELLRYECDPYHWALFTNPVFG